MVGWGRPGGLAKLALPDGGRRFESVPRRMAEKSEEKKELERKVREHVEKRRDAYVKMGTVDSED